MAFIHKPDLNDVVAAFSAAMATSGLTPAIVIADGKFHRFATSGRAMDQAGWYVLRNDDAFPNGAFGDFRTGMKVTWTYTPTGSLTDAEREARRLAMEAADAERRIEQALRNADAAMYAADIWAATRPAEPKHPYLMRKMVPTFSARQRGGQLVLDVRDLDGKLWSLQFIDPDGRKLLLKGGAKHGRVIPVRGDMVMPRRVLICEGWATGASLALEDPAAVVLAAVDAGNLQPVAINARYRWSGADIVICADADQLGRQKGRAAAIAAGATIAIPDFPPGVAGTDFNDLAAFYATHGAA
jgi:putative DNA primase/helicase